MRNDDLCLEVAILKGQIEDLEAANASLAVQDQKFASLFEMMEDIKQSREIAVQANEPKRVGELDLNGEAEGDGAQPEVINFWFFSGENSPLRRNVPIKEKCPH